MIKLQSSTALLHSIVSFVAMSDRLVPLNSCWTGFMASELDRQAGYQPPHTGHLRAVPRAHRRLIQINLADHPTSTMDALQCFPSLEVSPQKTASCFARTIIHWCHKMEA
jgi:hypothetical protein